MGSWGVSARESDTGLDYLALIKKNCLKPIDFKYFDVHAALEMLRNHIISGIKKENKRSLSKNLIWEYIDYNFPHSYNYAVLLVAECLAEYLKKGEFVIEDYESKTERKITEFIFTDSDLYELLKELYEMSNPNHNFTKSWFEEETRKKSQAHIEKLCKTLKRGFMR